MARHFTFGQKAGAGFALLVAFTLALGVVAVTLALGVVAFTLALGVVAVTSLRGGKSGPRRRRILHAPWAVSPPPPHDPRPMKPLRVLVVDDSPDDCELLLRRLRKEGYAPEHVRVDTADDMRAALARRPFDIVICDWSMPCFTAPAALALVRAHDEDLACLIVSGTIGEDVAVAALHAGARDFVRKDGLARLVPALERALDETALRREQKRMQAQLLRSDRLASVGLLAAGVAHEINNPLAAVMANLELAMASADAVADAPGPGTAHAELLAYLRDCRDATARIRAVVQDLTLVARADGDERTPIDVRNPLGSSLRLARHEIRRRARVVERLDDAPLVMANDTRLGQVFLNLIVNASQAMAETRVAENELRVATSRDERGWAVVEVSDNGAGMAPGVKARLFTPCFTTKAPGSGVGLGLSLSHRIVTALGGEITVESTLGAGSTFRVFLPPAPAGARARVAGENAPASSEAKRPVRRGQVLVADDDVPVANALASVLSPLHDVTKVHRARAALARLGAGERYDVILCDLTMPDMTGIELHAELVRTAPAQAAKMVFVAGGAVTLEARAFLAMTKNAVLEQPFAPPAGRALVNSLVE